LLAGVVVVTAVLGVLIADLTGRRDAAVLYVGLPALLAFGIAWSPRPRSLHGAVAAGTTFALLLAAILLQEGAICVLLSAPLVFAVAHTVAASPSARVAAGRRSSPSRCWWRASRGSPPTGGSSPSRPSPSSGPSPPTATPSRPAGRRPRPRRRAPTPARPSGFPLPSRADGDGLAPGDRWTFDYRGHPIVTEVVDRQERPDGGAVTFALVHDGSKTARWLTWEAATLRWSARADGRGTDVEVAVTFERGLDPSWWFGPVEDAFVRAGTSYLLDGLVGDLAQP
jgi:hypothetical protein